MIVTRVQLRDPITIGGQAKTSLHVGEGGKEREWCTLERVPDGVNVYVIGKDDSDGTFTPMSNVISLSFRREPKPKAVTK